MKDRLIGFIKTYCLFVCIFVLQKPLFMLFYKSLYPDASCADWFSVIWHGLPFMGHRTKRFFQWSGKMGERL